MSTFGPTLSQLGLDTTSPIVTGDVGAFQPIGLVDTSNFDPGTQLVDPTNTGDTGALQDTSTPFLPSVNNPETAGQSDLGAVLSQAINTGFAAWQLASQPRGTPKTVTTTVGPTRVVSGQAPSVLNSLFGGSAATTAGQSNLLTILIILIVGLLLYKAYGK